MCKVEGLGAGAWGLGVPGCLKPGEYHTLGFIDMIFGSGSVKGMIQGFAGTSGTLSSVYRLAGSFLEVLFHMYIYIYIYMVIPPPGPSYVIHFF